MNRLGLFFLFWVSWFAASAQFSDDFSTKSLSGWTQSAEGHWDIGYTGSDALEATNPQLHHSFDNTASGVDVISHKVSSVEYFNGDLTWKFRLKHGYDPSSTNGWTFMLCSSVDAKDYSDGVASESIHIGVNLKGSDDILKVWRQSIDAEGKSSITVLCETSVNWQIDITKSSCAYVIVTRSSEGEWKIKLSKSSFASANDVGSFNNKSSLPWGNFGINHWYTSSADQKLWVDDISIGFNKTKFTDNDSEIAVVELTNTAVDEIGATAEFFRMRVTDKGSGDNKPTSIREMKFKVVNGDMMPTDFSLIVNDISVPANGIYNGQFLTITPETSISVGDGETAEIGLLTTIPSNSLDGNTFSVEMESEGGIVLDDNSSKIGTIVSGKGCVVRLNIIASQLQSTLCPKAAMRNSLINIDLQAVDNLGNLDSDYIETVTLKLKADKGSTLEKTGQFVDGKVVFENITPIGESFFDISIRSGNLPEFVRRIVLVNDTTSFSTNISSRSIDVSCVNTDEKHSVTIAEFTVADIGDDGLPTILKTVDFSILPESISAEKYLGGIKAYSESQELPVRLSNTDANKFTVEFLNGGFRVDDKSIIPLRVDLFLSTSSLTDNSSQTFRLEGAIADSAGSLFGTFIPFETNTLNVHVDADTLYYSKFSSQVKPLELFNIDVKATDDNGNVDTDVVSVCQLTIEGAEKLVYEQNFVKGVAKFTSLQLPKSGLYKAYAQCNTLKTERNILVADADSYLKQSSEVVAIGKIVNSDEWFDASRFNIIDAGTSDTLSTEIREIQFVSYNLDGNEISSRVIEDASILIDGQSVVPSTISYTSGKFSFKYTSGSVVVPNGKELECLLRLKLRVANYVQPFIVDCNTAGIKVGESSSLISSLYSQRIVSDTIVYKELQPLILQQLEVVGDDQILLTFNNSLALNGTVKLYINGKHVGASFEQSSSVNKLRVKLLSAKLNSNLSNGYFENLKDVFGNTFIDDFNLAYCPRPESGDIIINEVLFNPDAGCSSYVEIKNVSDKAFDMKALSIARRDANGNLIEARGLSNNFFAFLPDKFALICSSPDEIAARYPMSDPSCFVVLPKMPQYSTKEGNVVLLDTAGTIIDEFSYSEKMHHGMLPTKKGVSLERVNPSSEAWHSASKEVLFGTPGTKNSQYSEAAGKSGFSLVSDIISPDGDGYNDYLSITYNLDEPGSVASIDIFSSAGKLVKHLRRNEMLGVEGSVDWDGIMDNGVHASRGIYLVLVRVTYASGKASTYKMPFSIAYR